MADEPVKPDAAEEEDHWAYYRSIQLMRIANLTIESFTREVVEVGESGIWPKRK